MFTKEEFNYLIRPLYAKSNQIRVNAAKRSGFDLLKSLAELPQRLEMVMDLNQEHEKVRQIINERVEEVIQLRIDEWKKEMRDIAMRQEFLQAYGGKGPTLKELSEPERGNPTNIKKPCVNLSRGECLHSHTKLKCGERPGQKEQKMTETSLPQMLVSDFLMGKPMGVDLSSNEERTAIAIVVDGEIVGFIL